MSLSLIFEELLNELTAKEIHKRYYSDMSDELFFLIISFDPRTRFKDGQLVKAGRFSKLLLDLRRKKKLRIEDLERAKSYLELIYKYNIPVSIKKINDLSDLHDLIKPYLPKSEKSLSAALAQLSEKEYDIVFNGQRWVIYQPKTEKAACYLGVNAEWCTAWGPYSLNDKHRERQNAFGRYSEALHIIVNKEDENEKYQFHKQTKQFMDVDDRSTSTSKFLEQNQEIKYFYFPLLKKEGASEDEIREQLKLSWMLPNEDVSKLLQLSFLKSNIQNPLCLAIMGENEDAVNELINLSDALDEPIYFGRSWVHFDFSRGLPAGIEMIRDVVSHYEVDADNTYDRVQYDISDWLYDDRDAYAVNIEGFFEHYYNENSDEIANKTGYMTYDDFKSNLFHSFLKLDSIKEEFISTVVEATMPNYAAECDAIVDSIHQFIKFDSYKQVSLSSPFFIQHLLKNNITKIDNEDHFEDIVDDYCMSNDVPTDHYQIDTYETVYPKPGDEHLRLTSLIEDKLNEIIDNFTSHEECAKQQEYLTSIVRKYFNEYEYVDNKYIHLSLLDKQVDCETGNIRISYTNKETGRSYQGPIKVENLINYLTNHQMFEWFVTFKKNI